MESGSVAQIKENHLYSVGFEFPAAGKSKLPRQPLPKLDNSQDVFIPRQQRPGLVLSTGLVLSYNTRQSTAVILVGVALPSFPHRYVPWEGTARLPHQPLECLKLSGARFLKKGYLNYTHCLRVRVMKEGERRKVAIHDPTPQLMVLHVLDKEVSKLRKLHSAYWEGIRYSEDGLPMGDDRLGRKEAELSDEEEDKLSEVEYSRLLKGRLNNMKHDIYPYKIKQVFVPKEEKATQVELMDGGEGGQVEELDDLLKCHFFPFNRQMISHLA